MAMTERGLRGLPTTTRSVALAAITTIALACSDTSPPTAPDVRLALDTTRLCPLVPARDPAAASFPPSPPVKVFGTDLGWTYAANGRVPILFGDSWQRIDICPIQSSDDSIGTLALPANDWPGFTATGPISDADCPQIDFEVDAAGTAFAPIELRRWDGVPVPLGPLNTPVAAFYDGRKEWAVFIVAGGQSCTAEASARGAACPAELSPQAADLVCGTVTGKPLCIDPTSTRTGDGAQAYYLHIAERVGPSAYVTRALFLTNKMLNFTARTVRRFDPSPGGVRDYSSGTGALLMWGRPGFDDLSGDGESPPFFLYQPLPFEVSDDQIVFQPRYFTKAVDGVPQFGSSQTEAQPLYTGELEPVNQAAVSWIAPLSRWLMIYGGSSADLADPGDKTGRGQPIEGALVARVARDPWGPWTPPEPILTNEQTAQDLVCGHQAPAGCLVPPEPPIRPACIEAADPKGGGSLYGANIIDPLTRPSATGHAADVFWNYSTWHPYSVVLARTRVAID